MLDGFCKNCGKELVRKRFNGRLEDNGAFRRRVFCNRECMAVAFEGQIKVMNPKNSRRQSVKHRLDACEDCGRKATRLHNHHQNENPLLNVGSNLTTLCASCHKLRHSPNNDPMTGRRLPCLYCARPSRGKRLCETHLTRLKRYGHPLAKKRKIQSEWVLMLFDGEKWEPFPSS